LFYYSCCNNFWWCLNNVAKGIARDELPYAMHMLNDVVRAELHDMINWYIGTQQDSIFPQEKMANTLGNICLQNYMHNMPPPIPEVTTLRSGRQSMRCAICFIFLLSR